MCWKKKLLCMNGNLFYVVIVYCIIVLYMAITVAAFIEIYLSAALFTLYLPHTHTHIRLIYLVALMLVCMAFVAFIFTTFKNICRCHSQYCCLCRHTRTYVCIPSRKCILVQDIAAMLWYFVCYVVKALKATIL